MPSYRNRVVGQQPCNNQQVHGRVWAGTAGGRPSNYAFSRGFKQICAHVVRNCSSFGTRQPKVIEPPGPTQQQHNNQTKVDGCGLKWPGEVYMGGVLTSLFYRVVTTWKGGSFAVVKCDVVKRFIIFNLGLSLYYLSNKMMFKKITDLWLPVILWLHMTLLDMPKKCYQYF